MCHNSYAFATPHLSRLLALVVLTENYSPDSFDREGRQAYHTRRSLIDNRRTSEKNSSNMTQVVFPCQAPGTVESITCRKSFMTVANAATDRMANSAKTKRSGRERKYLRRSIFVFSATYERLKFPPKVHIRAIFDHSARY